MADLFDTIRPDHEPLAARMRPRNLDEYIGQNHIVGKGRLLRRAIAADQLSSVIFYGPPGTGKTTLAKVIANHTKSNFITLNAVLTGVADIRKAISEAEDLKKLYGRKTILFVDEVHRWNKSQQDALLPWVENGTLILIGATTENPFFEVNKALVSRSRVFQLKSLTKEDLTNAAHQAIKDIERGYGHWIIDFEEGALEHLVETANGDARSLLNALELAIETTPEEWDPKAANPKPAWGSTIFISKETAEESIQKKIVLYDKDGDYHYDIISAFIKSLRGRDPDAALYWLAKMVRAGEDPNFIFRRMLISACEDTGLADPNAITIVQNCAQAFDRVGLPEGRFFLTHAALYLATAPKSNSSLAFFDALNAVEKERTEVPNHLKDANRDAEGFGHGAGYMYPHAYKDHWVAQQYLPKTLEGRVFYSPSTQGYENKIREEVLTRRELQIAALLESQNSINNENLENKSLQEWWISEHFKANETIQENLTFSPENKEKKLILDNAEKLWQNRLDTNKSEVLELCKKQMLEMANILRHHRTLIWNANDGLLIFEISRKTPEGYTCGICKSKEGMDLLNQYYNTMDEIDKPALSIYTNNNNSINIKDFRISLEKFGETEFDKIFFRNIFTSIKSVEQFIEFAKEAYEGKEKTKKDFASSEEISIESKTQKAFFDKDAQIIFEQKIPSHAQLISFLIKENIFKNKVIDNKTSLLLKEFEEAEKEFFTNQNHELFNWDIEDIKNLFLENGFNFAYTVQNIVEKRRLNEMEINKWFDFNKSSYGKHILKKLGIENLDIIKKILKNHTEKHLFNWNNTVAFFSVNRKK